MRSTIAIWLTLALVSLALVPTAWVLLVEALRRVRTRTALRQVEEARRHLGESPDASTATLARSLVERFDALTIDRAVVELLRSEDAAARALGTRLFAQLGLVEIYSRRLRIASKWSERTHAAEILGLAGSTTAVPALVDALRDRDEDEASVKAAAAAALAKLRDESAIPLLVKELFNVDERSSRNVAESLVAFGSLAVTALLDLLLDSSQPAARIWSARILGRIGDGRAVDSLIVRLGDRDDQLRVAAAEALGAIGDPRSLQAVVRATLRDPAPQVRAHAAGAVARIEGERAVDVLVSALSDPDYATRIRALEAFEMMRIEDTSALETGLRDPNAEVRRRAALALERVGYLERVVARLASEDRTVRLRAFDALLEIGQVGLVESIAAYVHHPSFEVRAIAARACGELGVVRVAPLLLRAITDEAWPVRAAVCDALGRLCHDDAPAALVRALEDTEETVRESAAEALTSYTPQQLGPHAQALDDAYDRGTVAIRKSVVLIAGRVGGDIADALLVRACVDPSDAVRLPAVTAMSHAGGDARIEPLVARLTDASLDVRMAAVTALGAIGRVEAFEGLLRALPGAPRMVRDRIAEALARGDRASLLQRLPELERSASLDIRLGIAWTLGKISDAAGVPTLARFLRDADATLRASAAGALAKIPDPAAREVLLGAVQDPDGRVRAAVVNALGRVGGNDSSVLAALELRARDPDRFVRNRAILALARAGQRGAEERVRAHADEADPVAQLVALALVGTEAALTSVLEALSGDQVLHAVLKFLEHEDPAVRASFFSALHLEDPSRSGVVADTASLLEQYERTLRTSLDVDARRLAVAAVDRLGVERAIPVLADALTGDPNETVRLRAAALLARHASDEVARRALVRAVADPSAEVAVAAVRAIGAQREPEVITALQRRLGAGTDEVQDVIEAALALLHRDDPTPFVDWMMGVDVPDQLIPAVRVIGRMANAATFPLLRELVSSRSIPVRVAAVAALGNLQVPEAASTIDAMAQDPSEEVRVAVIDAVQWSAHALARLSLLRRDPSVRVRTRIATTLERAVGPSAKTAHRALEGMLGDASPVVRSAALASLAASSDADGLRAFGRLWPQSPLDTRMALRREPRARPISELMATRLSSSGDPVERKCAVVALGALAVPGYDVYITPALNDPSPDVRVAAIHALAAIDDRIVRQRFTEMLSDPEVAVQEAARRSLVQTVG